MYSARCQVDAMAALLCTSADAWNEDEILPAPR